MAMQEKTKVVGCVAVKDGYGIVVHDQTVVYEGTLQGAVKTATQLVGAFIMTSLATKEKLDTMIGRQDKGKPIAH